MAFENPILLSWGVLWRLKILFSAFKMSNGIVYVLPETRSPQKVFASYDPGEP